MKNIVFGLVFGINVLFANTLVVDNSSNFSGFTNCEGFGFGSTYTTIQSAVTAANSGDTIKICKGDYNEAVAVNGINNLTITNGADASSPSDINWYSSGDTLTINGDTKNLTVKNLSIKTTSSSANNYNIYIKSANDKITFENLIIDSSNGANAIWGGGSVDDNLQGVFKHLSITSGASGIHLDKANLQDFEDINMTLSSTSGNNKGIYLGTSVQDENHIFKDLSLSVNAEPAIELSSGKKMTFEDVNITATGYSVNTKAISLDNSTTADDLTFQDVNISVNSGIGVYIAKAKDITANNLIISGTTNNAFLTDSQVTGNFSFDTLSMNIGNDGGLVLKNGNDVTISHASISGSGGNGLGIYTDSGVVGNFTFSDISISAHAGGVDIKKGNNVSFSNVKVFSDSSSANDHGVVFDGSSFNQMSFANCDFNATGKALKISGSSDLTIDSSKLTTRGDSAIYIDTNVEKMHLKNSCIHDTSTSGNSYAIYINNWKDIHINNNCIYAPNGGIYARDTKAHDWDGNYWDGVTDANGDGKISNADTNKISSNIVDNSPKSSCEASGCSGGGGSTPVLKNYKFDAWDTFRDRNDRNISTETVNQDFNLTIASLDENGTNYQEFNGTVCAKVDNNEKKLDFRDQNSTTATFKISKAIKDIRVHIAWKKDVDENCPLSNEDNSTDSADNFAVRPEKFSIDINTTSFYAGVPFRMDLNASMFGGGNSIDYNETNGTSFSFDKIDSNASCVSGTLGGLPIPLRFSDGGISFDANYSDVGDVNFTINEINGSEFAFVDRDDTNDSVRLIQKFSKSITVEPYQFAIVDYKFERNPDQNWRYMSDVKDMNITASFRIQAQNYMGNVTHKFDGLCYSNDVNFTIDVNSTSSDGNLSYFEDIDGTDLYGHDKSLNHPSLNGVLNRQNFSDGNSSKVTYALNIYREYDRPKNPLSLQFIDINTTYLHDLNVKNPGFTLDNNMSRYYFARVKTKDIDTNKKSVRHSLDIEVYSTANLSNFHQNSLSWYGMKDDNITKIVDFLPKEGFTMSTPKSGIDDINSTQSIANGIVGFNITNSWSNPDSAYIHLKIPKYLWYSRYNVYDDNGSSDCGSHPCFKYNYLQKVNSSNIKSGNFSGTSIGSEYNASKVSKKGVKVFR